MKCCYHSGCSTGLTKSGLTPQCSLSRGQLLLDLRTGPSSVPPKISMLDQWCFELLIGAQRLSGPGVAEYASSHPAVNVPGAWLSLLQTVACVQ